MKTVGFDNTSSERSREPVMLEQSEASKNAGLFTPNNNHCKSNFKKQELKKNTSKQLRLMTAVEYKTSKNE